MIGCCSPRELCDLHLAGAFQQMKGVCALRGELWAEQVALSVSRSREWPQTERMLAIARRPVTDLASDERLLEMLTDECASWAERRWVGYRR